MNHLDIYTDGSFPWPTDPEYRSDDVTGAWSYVLLFKDVTIEKSGTYSRDNDVKSTNNRCEMMGIIKALESVQRNKLITFDTITVFTDSQYAKGAISGENKARKNLDLVMRGRNVVTDLSNSGSSITFQWVKGHAGDKYNEIADGLANAALHAFKEAAKSAI